MTRERDPLRMPRAGAELAPLAALTAHDLQRAGVSLRGRTFLARSTLAGMAVLAVHQALLTGLRTEVLRRRGALSRREQLRLILVTVAGAVREGAALGLVLGMLLFLLPGLALPLSLLGMVGMGRASLDLFHAFWDGLTPRQREELHEAAYEAGARLGAGLRGLGAGG